MHPHAIYVPPLGDWRQGFHAIQVMYHRGVPIEIAATFTGMDRSTDDTVVVKSIPAKWPLPAAAFERVTVEAAVRWQQVQLPTLGMAHYTIPWDELMR